jgi:hypothetical protein
MTNTRVTPDKTPAFPFMVLLGGSGGGTSIGSEALPRVWT